MFSFNFWIFETIGCQDNGTSGVQVALIGLMCKDLLSLHPEAIRGSSQQQLQLPLKMYTVEGY